MDITKSLLEAGIVFAKCALIIGAFYFSRYYVQRSRQNEESKATIIEKIIVYIAAIAILFFAGWFFTNFSYFSLSWFIILLIPTIVGLSTAFTTERKKFHNKNTLMILVFLFIGNSAIGQIDHVKILLGKTDVEVTTYLDSLNKLKSNPYYKIKRTVSDAGDLIITTDFALNDETYYKCLSITVLFQRAYGKEYAAKELITGTAPNSYSNLSFIKDNFQFVSEGKWEWLYPDMPLKQIATFSKDNGEYQNYSIIYELTKK